jgi:type IV pilus assembly protein PilV
MRLFKRKTWLEQGFTLVEFLVAIVILSVGLLGMAGLQLSSLRNDSKSYMRTQAAILAADLADKVRANPGVSYEGLSASSYPGCNSISGCSPATMAGNDLAEWQQIMTAELDTGTGLICLDSTPNDGVDTSSPACDGNGTTMAIKIWWVDVPVDGGNTPLLERYVMSFQP